jgi:hypothetical protein
MQSVSGTRDAGFLRLPICNFLRCRHSHTLVVYVRQLLLCSSSPSTAAYGVCVREFLIPWLCVLENCSSSPSTAAAAPPCSASRNSLSCA